LQYRGRNVIINPRAGGRILHQGSWSIFFRNAHNLFREEKSMKYISFAIPCYNSEAYMEKAVNSILVGGEDVEIIIVNDGSKDGTQEIAEKYQEKYPTIVKAVKKENGGHGDAVNCGLEHAAGKYFKVVDSDDW